MVSIKNDIININDISIETNNYNNTNIDNINKYIFDLFALFQKYFNEELQIKFDFTLPNGKSNSNNLFVKVKYISYFNQYTSNTIKLKLNQVMKDNQNFINQLIDTFQTQANKKKQDCIFILFTTKSNKSDSYNGYMPILINDHSTKIIIKINNTEIFNTKNY